MKKVLAQGQLGVIPTKILFGPTLRVGLVKPCGNLVLPYFQAFWANLGVGLGGGSKLEDCVIWKVLLHFMVFFGFNVFLFMTNFVDGKCWACLGLVCNFETCWVSNIAWIIITLGFISQNPHVHFFIKQRWMLIGEG
jgi:hypothetical protein